MSYDPDDVSPPLGVALLGDEGYADFCAWFYASYGISWQTAWAEISMCVFMGVDPMSVVSGAPTVPPPGVAAAAWAKVIGWIGAVSGWIGGGVPVVVPPIPIRSS